MTSSKMANLSNNVFTAVKPTLGAARMLLDPPYKLGHFDILTAFNDTGHISVLFTTYFFRSIMAILVHTWALTDRQAYHNEYPKSFESSLFVFFSFWHPVLDQADDFPLDVLQTVQRSVSVIFITVFMCLEIPQRRHSSLQNNV